MTGIAPQKKHGLAALFLGAALTCSLSGRALAGGEETAIVVDGCFRTNRRALNWCC